MKKIIAIALAALMVLSLAGCGEKKSTKTKRNLRKPAMTDATNVKNMKKILPYL